MSGIVPKGAEQSVSTQSDSLPEEQPLIHVSSTFKVSSDATQRPVLVYKEHTRTGKALYAADLEMFGVRSAVCTQEEPGAGTGSSR